MLIILQDGAHLGPVEESRVESPCWFLKKFRVKRVQQKISDSGPKILGLFEETFFLMSKPEEWICTSKPVGSTPLDLCPYLLWVRVPWCFFGGYFFNLDKHLSLM